MAEILTLDLSPVQNPGDFGLTYQDEEDTEEDHMEEVDPLSDDFSPEDSLPPLRRILSYYKSDSADNRHLCIRLFPDALQTMSTMTELNMLLQAVLTLARDHNHIIRIGLLANIPGLVEKNIQFSLGEEEIAAENRQQLLDIIIRMLTDTEMEVRREGQNVIVILLSRDCSTDQKGDLLEKLFPVIKRCLGRDENYDLRMDAAMLISKMSALVGQTNVLKYFVPLLPALASDTMFHVRKAFAMSCRELCPVLEEELVEQHVLPLYLSLCKDEVWGVRKACADVFSEVSHACNLGTRYDQLTPAFLKLLHDDSRWVRKAAYQSLGAFISTFYIPNENADSDTTSANQNPEGVGDESSLGILSNSMLQDDSLLDSPAPLGAATTATASTTATSDSSSHSRHTLQGGASHPVGGGMSNTSTPIHAGNGDQVGSGNQNHPGIQHLVQNPEFSNFEFWRSPITDVKEESGKSKEEGGSSKVTEEGVTVPDGTVKARLTFECPDEGGGRGGGEGDRPDTTQSEGGVCLSGGCGEGEEGCGGVAPVSNFGGIILASDEDEVTSSSSSEENFGHNNSSSSSSSSSEELTHQSQGGNKHEGKGSEEVKEKVDVADSSLSAKGGSPSAKEAGLDGPQVNGDVSSGGVGTKDVGSSDTAGTLGVVNAGSVRLRSSSAGAVGGAVRRVSVECGQLARQHERLLVEKRRRRWSLNTPNNLNNPPQVRVFIHSASGQVTEQDLTSSSSSSEDTTSPSALEAPSDQSSQPGEEQGTSDSVHPHNHTSTKSMLMELTLEPNSTTLDTKCEEEPYVEQEIVPDELMEVYLSMTEHSRVQTVDTDLLYYCAYSLPGVTLTLGSSHWELLKPTFDYLAEDLQWRIRRVLAFSLHELARVLGTEITCRDLLPIFEEYCTKDVDDVKIGTLTHLSEFIEFLPLDIRERCLPKVLDGLLQMENQKNWRYRNTLVEQLLLVSELFDPKYLHEHVYPLALLLSADKVAEVRNSASFLIGTLLQRISHGNMEMCHTLLQKLRSSLVPHSSWLQRLMYVKQCETFLLNKHISYDAFARECLPSILQLARDKVPNIRIAIAKLLKDSVIPCDYFQTERSESFSLEELQITLECLQHDADRDVKYFAGGEVTATPRRLIVFPRQWYSQRARSDSHASSDPDQYQDAAEYLNLDLGSSSTSHPLDKPVSSHTEYLNLIPGLTPFGAPDNAPLLSVQGVRSADVPGVVVQDIEVASDQDTSCDASNDHSAAHPNGNVESSCQEVNNQSVDPKGSVESSSSEVDNQSVDPKGSVESSSSEVNNQSADPKGSVESSSREVKGEYTDDNERVKQS